MNLAADRIRRRCDLTPRLGIILGSGLGGIADQVESSTTIDYADIPGFASSTAGGHRGQLILGHIDDCPVVVMAGRLHRYEGHARGAIVQPVLTMAALGATTLIVSNAAGGLKPSYAVGDLVAIEDHIDWLGDRTGLLSLAPSSPALLPRKSQGDGGLHRSPIYDADLIQTACQTGLRAGFAVHRGTYLATLGPTYETRAEYRMMRRIGADLAGMSTVPEAVAAAQAGLAVLAISMVSNVANPDQPVTASHDEVLHAGRRAAVKMECIVREVACRLNSKES